MNSFDDIKRYISEQPIFQEFYVENYIELVSEEYFKLIKKKGFTWGKKLPKISDNQFWKCFKCAEIKEKKSE